MKIIDDKGRIFGKINIIDFIIILFLISLLSMFYYGYKLFYFHPKPEKKFYAQTLSIKGLVYDIDSEVLNKINKGDKAFDIYGNEIGEITEVGGVKKIKRKIDIGQDKYMFLDDTKLSLKLKLKGNLKDNVFVFNGQGLRYGQSINFKTPEYNLKVLVIPKEGQEDKFKTARIRILAENVFPEVADLVSVGDREYMEDNQTEENFLPGKIVSILRKDNSRVALINKDEKVEFFGYSRHKEIELVLSLNIMKKKELIYYKDVPIKVGSIFTFKTVKYNLNCRVLEIINDK